jgi:Protein of unknown function (DUF3175)
MTAPEQKRWSQHVTETSDALNLEPDVFTLDDPAEIARSLSESAEKSTRRKAEPFRSAMSMLTFYINRAGKSLPEERKKTLEKAKDELRRLYGRAARNAPK